MKHWSSEDHVDTKDLRLCYSEVIKGKTAEMCKFMKAMPNAVIFSALIPDLLDAQVVFQNQ